MPLESSAEQPLPVRTVALAIARWVGRLGRVWVEGQVTELTARPGSGTAFLVLRDPLAEVSLRVTCPRLLLDDLQPPLRHGARVVVCGRPEVHPARGSLALAAVDLRPVGVGELLARLERLRAMLAAEGLFAPELKRPLPLLPRTVGLVTGRAGAAERDVVEVARRRWPALRFRVLQVAVQGPTAAAEIAEALRSLDRDPEVDVIVLARGGGSVEDLLPFSDEGLCRAVAACRTPVVSAVGHEGDSPLVDHVADRRAATPTDAGKIIAPDAAEERQRVHRLRRQARQAVVGRLSAEQHRLDLLRGHPALRRPEGGLHRRAGEVRALQERAGRAARGAAELAAAELAALSARLDTLSPAATLRRGYAVLQTATGDVVRSPAQVAPGDAVRARLAEGQLALVVSGPAGRAGDGDG